MDSKIVAFTILIFLILLNIKFGHTERCSNFKINKNLQKSSILKRIQENTMEDLWDIGTPTLSKKGKTLRDALFDMFYSSNKLWRSTALVATQWIWAYLPQLEYSPNLCHVAQIINATVIYNKNKKNNTLFEALDKLNETMHEGTLMALDTGMDNTGCDDGDEDIERLTEGECYKQGLVYLFDELWHMECSKYPTYYKNAVKSLYFSKSNKDKVMGLFGTASISQYFASMLNFVAPEIRYQIAHIAGLDDVPFHCCQKLRDEIDNVEIKMLKECENALIKTKRNI